MAAYAAITSLMHILDQLHNHPSPPISLDTQQVGSLNEIATFLQQFLEAYDSPFGYSEEADPLEIRIMNAACAAEDAIESHIVKVIKTTTTYHQQTYFGKETEDDSEEETRSTASNLAVKGDSEVETRSTESKDDDSEEDIRSSSSGKIKVNLYEDLHRVKEEEDHSEEKARSISSEQLNLEVSCINLYQDLHQVIEEMDSIKKVAMNIDAGKEVVQDFSSRSSSTEQRLNTNMVCSDDVLLEIMDKLVSGSRHRQVIPITGMGGIGKTTLARTVYSKPLVKEYFDICVWVTISQKFNTMEILRELLCQATKKKKEEVELSEDDAGLSLHRYLFGRRFLIVMDDMWSIDAWDEIHRFFPDNENGSRVLVTTRLAQLTSQLTNDYSLEMKFLDGVRGWELFSKTVFGEESCPFELVEIGEKIVHDCKGLPLSIIVVGGALKQMENTRERWESIRQNLTSVVNLENDEHCLRLLKLSYNHLPSYLKPCFLYMGVFAEDDRILVSVLVKLWVSEGFLKPMNGESLETIAKGYIRDLIDRNLILIDGLTCRGIIKYCKIHDLLRDLCLREAHKYGFYDVIGQCSIHQGINSQRRLVIPEKTSLLYDVQSMPLTRSILCEHGYVLSCQNSRLLRILRDNAYSYQWDLNTLAFEFVNLRHFSGAVYKMSSFLSPIILVWNLHTLIVNCLEECKAPNEIWKMAQFRHIEFRGQPLYLSDPDGTDDVVMENLQILKGVKNFKCGEEVLRICPNLRKLRIRYFDDEVIEHYSLSNIERLSKLESLSISCEYKFDEIAFPHDQFTFPHSLKSLTLHLRYDIELEDMLGKIGSLPLLQKLKLNSGCFGMGKWEIGEDQFPCLKYLSLSSCSGLKHWTTSSIFPRLEHLHLYHIEELERIPCEIGDIATLQKIELYYCCESVVMSVRDIVEEQVELQGEDLSFHVVVRVWSYEAAPRGSLAGHPYFKVIL